MTGRAGGAAAIPAGVTTVHLACSSGGHIDLLERLRETLPATLSPAWVTQDSERARALRDRGERVSLLPAYDRHPLRGRLAATLRRSAAIVARERPRIVITTGSGLVVPFCVMARAWGARVIFVETSARVRTPSRAGRVLSRLAGRTLVQWPALLARYPRSVLCLPSILERARDGAPAAHGEGALVMVGTHVAPFDRLLRAADDAAGNGLLGAPVTMQTGASDYVPRHAEASRWLAPGELDRLASTRRYIVCHAGTGAMSAALEHGRRPLVLARRAALGEHFDDHQAELVRELGALDLIVELDGEIGPQQLAAARQAPRPQPAHEARPLLAEALRQALAEAGSPAL